MIIRALFLLLVVFSLPSVASAKSISAQKALDRAVGSDSGIFSKNVKNDADRAVYTLAYSAPSGSWYAFNRSTGGYIIVSGDDRIYAVLADVASGEFSEADIAPGAQYMLSVYDGEISSLTGQDTGERNTIMDYYAQWAAIEPLMTTMWNQSYPYNQYCPVIGSSTCVTGCVATAMAQVVKCIGFYEGSGFRSYSGVDSHGDKVEFDFGAYSFDFDNMFDYYPSSVTDQQLEQVGKLMVACGLSVSMGYGVSASAAYSNNVPRALINNFGYDGTYTRLYDRADFSQAQWENMIYSQLRLNRPVYYSGSSGASGHAFVVDGYRPMGMYHVNWGWGGMSDGYYRLSALNPAQQGIGGGSGGFSGGQDMVVAVPRGADPGVVNDDMSGGISRVDDGVYSVYYKSNGVMLQNVDIGAAIVDSSDRIVATSTFWPKQQFTSSMALRHDSYSYDFATIPLDAGIYRIYPAYCPDGGIYTIAAKYAGRQHYVNLEVTADGQYLFTNLPAEQYSPDVHIAGIDETNDIHKGVSGALNFYVVNNGYADYVGNAFRLTMIDADGNDIVSFDSDIATVAAQASGYVTSPFPVFDNSNSLIPAGVYSLRFADSNGNILSDREFSVEVKNGSPLSVWTNDENIEVTNPQTMPSALVKGDIWPHTPLIKTNQTNRSMTLRVAFYPPSSVAATANILCYQGTIGPMEAMFPLEPTAVDVPFGTYEACYRKGYSQISQRHPIRIGVSIDGVGFLPATGGGASVSMMGVDSGLEEIVVPAQISADGVVLPVSAVDAEGFIMQNQLRSLDIPSSVKSVGMNAFAACPSLEQIILRSSEPPFAYRNFVAGGLSGEAKFYVPAESFDKYSRLLSEYNPVYTIVESIESATVTMDASSAAASVSFSPAHENVDPDFVITPTDGASASVADVRVVSVENGRVNLAITALSEGKATFHIKPAHRSDDHAVLTVVVPEATGAVDEIGQDTVSEWPADVYTPAGVLLIREASESDFMSLPRGIYILRTEHGVYKRAR